MSIIQKAINYETMAYVLKKSDTHVIPLFDTVASMCDTGEPLVDHLTEYLSVLTVSGSDMQKAYSQVAASFEVLQKMDDVKIIDYTSSCFPKEAKNIPFLYLRGNENLLTTIGICVVGTRTPSENGVKATRDIVDIAGSMGLTIVSGLAKGIDGIAHIQALSKGFPTIGVVGTPINEVYPREHEKLQEYIAHRGLVCSMFAPCRQTQKYYFLLRDELMAMIGKGSFIAESNDGGGAVKQAKYSESLGKNVFVLRSTYENRTYLWPRSFKNPVVLSDAKQLKYSFDRVNTALNKPSYGNSQSDSQLSLF